MLAISGKRVRQIKDELGITPGLLNKWKQRYQLHPATGDVKPSDPYGLEAKNRRLRRELALVQAERDLLKKAVKLFASGWAMSNPLIQAERGVLPVEQACRALKVSTSGYYAWQKRQGQVQASSDEAQTVAPIISVFEASRGTYGSPRVVAACVTTNEWPG